MPTGRSTLLPLMLFLCFTATPRAAEKTQLFIVAGYLPSYRFESFDFRRASMLTDVILFSLAPNADGSLDLDNLPPDALRSARRKLAGEDCRVLVTIGGWGKSTAFGKVTADERLRTRLVRNLAQLCDQEKLDGVDVDWEHPRDDKQREQLGQFLAELKKSLQPKKRLVTIAAAPWEKLNSATIAAVDRVHLMAYDNGGRHSTPEYAEDGIERMLKQGVPAEKLCLGIPFYGRPYEGEFGKGRMYSDIAARHKLSPQADEVDGIYFNGPATVAEKVALAEQRKLAGVMIWEIGQDVPGGERSLLRAIDRPRP
jgi:GH18 family chitinase